MSRRLFLAACLCALCGFSAAPATPRSPAWPALAKKHLVSHPTCAACGATKGVVVHHVRPVHLFPELELDEANLVTLCPTCHLVFGHCGDWQAWNPEVRQEAAEHLKRVKRRKYDR